MGDHIPAQGDLVAGTHQIVLRVSDGKILVPPEVIVQEPDHQLGGHADTAQCQGIQLLPGDGSPGFFQEALGKGLEYIQVDAHPVIFRAVLRHEIGSKADGVAEVVAHQSRHHRIQVDDHQGLVGLNIKQDIVDLGIVMGHPEGELPRPAQIGEGAGQVPDGLDVA